MAGNKENHRFDPEEVSSYMEDFQGHSRLIKQFYHIHTIDQRVEAVITEKMLPYNFGPSSIVAGGS